MQKVTQHSITTSKFGGLISVLKLSLLISSVLCGKSVFAEPASFAIGESEIFPQLRLEYFGNDNAFAASNNPVDQSGVRVKPSFTWVADKGTTALRAGYQGEFSSSDVSEADYTNHNLSFDATAEFSSRTRASAGLDYDRRSEDPGSGLSGNTDGLLNDLNVIDDLQFNTRFVYGAQNARGNLEVGLRFRDFAYNNNSEFTSNSNYTELTPYGVFSLRTSGSTRATLELRYRDFDYETYNGDRKELNFLVGARWAESEKFGGSVAVGAINSSYSNSAIADGNDLAIEIGGYYLPLSYSRFDVNLTRSLYNINDSTEIQSANEAISDLLSINWLHQWSSRLSSRALLTREAIQRDCTSSDDVEFIFRGEFQFNIRRWLGLGAGVGQRSRSFDGCTIRGNLVGFQDFDEQEFTIFLNVSL